METIVRVVLDIRTDEDPAACVLAIEHQIGFTILEYSEVVAASGKRLEAGEPQTGAEHVG
jgi:hypothetical protein